MQIYYKYWNFTVKVLNITISYSLYSNLSVSFQQCPSMCEIQQKYKSEKYRTCFLAADTEAYKPQ